MDLYRHQVREISEYAMFTLDPQGILQSWNAGVERLMGYSEQGWLGQPASIIFTPAEKAMEVCEAEMRKAQESGSATDIRWHRRKDGSVFPVEVSITSLPGSTFAPTRKKTSS